MSAIFAALTWLIVMVPLSSSAQQVNHCPKSELGDPPRVVYQCAGGLVLEAEAAAALGIVSNGASGRPNTVELTKDGVLVEVEPGSGPFQILTPHAIAAVRGTVYAVDVTDNSTSVFVMRGEVVVSHSDGSEGVSLSPGFGVEVFEGEPLIITRWPSVKVERLLARFGR
ncbi:FecR family protein [Roseibium sp. H3510]|uniref:FecR family protein n=1 Tax=Roseibium algae TaxID=3123038 RepID=A0ABU8TKI4_9HYPH